MFGENNNQGEPTLNSMQRNTRNRQAVPDRERGVVVGIDVSKRKMDFGAFRGDECSKRHSVGQDSHGLQTLRDLMDDLASQGYEPWIAFEPTGPYSTCLREWMISNNWHVVQVNPYHVKRTKEVRDNSPHKTDGKDPSVIADLVWQGCYQELVSLSGTYAELRAASAEWASLTKKRTAIRNEFQGLLEVWFPEIAEVFKDAVCQSVRGIVRKYPTVTALASARLSSVRATLRKASAGRSMCRSESILSAAKSSMAPICGQQARHSAMVNLLDMLDAVDLRRSQLLAEMHQFLGTLTEAGYMLSLPGIGAITVSGLLGECGNIGKFKSYEQLEKFLGLNLYEVSSGKHKGKRHISKRGRALARCLICHIALTQTRPSSLYGQYAREMRDKGKKTGEIRVAVARKLLRLLYAIARDCRVFDPQQFITGARTEHGPVIQQGTQAQAA